MFSIRARGALPAGLATVTLILLSRLGVAILEGVGLSTGGCGFKQAFGLPCPGCGATRALDALFRLQPQHAFAMSPLATVAALVALAWATADACLWLGGRALEVRLPVRALLALALAVTGNWTYLILAGR